MELLKGYDWSGIFLSIIFMVTIFAVWSVVNRGRKQNVDETFSAKCPACKGEMHPSWNFCPICGERLSEE